MAPIPPNPPQEVQPGSGLKVDGRGLIYTYIYIYIYIYISIYTYMYIFVIYRYTYAYAYKHMNTHTHIYIYICIKTNLFEHACIHIYGSGFGAWGLGALHPRKCNLVQG